MVQVTTRSEHLHAAASNKIQIHAKIMQSSLTRAVAHIAHRPAALQTFRAFSVFDRSAFFIRKLGTAQYEVNLSFKDKEAKQKFCDFLVAEHMPHVMETVPEQFFDASISDDTEDPLKAVVRYYSKSKDGIDFRGFRASPRFQTGRSFGLCQVLYLSFRGEPRCP